jgi:hypothetical protein
MDELLEILSSKAKLSVLLVLYRQSLPIPLRHIAHIAEIPVYSVQNALKELLKSGAISKKKSGNYLLICLNREHPIYEILEGLAEAISHYHMKMNSEKFARKAISSLAFSSSAKDLFNGIRKS